MSVDFLDRGSVSALVAAWVGLAGACSALGGGDRARIDGGAGHDDGAPAADADPSCSGWELVSVPIASVELMDVTPVHPQRTARLRVSALHCPGDERAMLQRIPGPEPGYLFIDARVWRLRGAADCDEPEVVDRLIEVNFLFEGPTSVMSDRELLVVDVEPPPLVSCGQGGSRCDLDCQCEGDERCLSFSDGGRPETACARPCELDRDCLGDGPCASLPTGLESVCDSGSPECTGTRPCPAGFACRSGQCEPEFVLDGNTRHACSCDSQCDFPLRCAFGFDQTEGRCDIICPTGGPGWCQGSNVCGTPFETGSESVCGWNGAE